MKGKKMKEEEDNGKDFIVFPSSLFLHLFPPHSFLLSNRTNEQKSDKIKKRKENEQER